MSRGTVRPVVTVLAVGFSVTLLLISDKGIRDWYVSTVLVVYDRQLSKYVYVRCRRISWSMSTVCSPRCLSKFQRSQATSRTCTAIICRSALYIAHYLIMQNNSCARWQWRMLCQCVRRNAIPRSTQNQHLSITFMRCVQDNICQLNHSGCNNINLYSAAEKFRGWRRIRCNSNKYH